MIRWVLGAAGIICVAVLVVYALSQPAQTTVPPEIVVEQTIALEGIPIQVAIVDTESSRTRGLSGYAPLRQGQGMLFIFDEEGLYSFWMKDMLFSIDILWFDTEGILVHIEEHVSPASYPTSFTPDSLARYVLEVPAGFVAEHKIIAGSKLTNFPSGK